MNFNLSGGATLRELYGLIISGFQGNRSDSSGVGGNEYFDCSTTSLLVKPRHRVRRGAFEILPGRDEIRTSLDFNTPSTRYHSAGLIASKTRFRFIMFNYSLKLYIRANFRVPVIIHRRQMHRRVYSKRWIPMTESPARGFQLKRKMNYIHDN